MADPFCPSLQIGFGWRHACFLLLPLPLVLVAAFALLRFPALVADSETAGRTPLRHLLRGRWFWGALAAIFLGGATELGMAQWLPAYAETTLGYPQWVGGMALLLFSVAWQPGEWS